MTVELLDPLAGTDTETDAGVATWPVGVERGMRPAAPRLGREYASALERLKRYAELTGLPLLLVVPESGAVLARAGEELPEFLPQEILEHSPRDRRPRVIEHGSGLTFALLPLPAAQRREPVALSFVLTRAGTRPAELVLAAASRGWSKARLDRWLSRQQPCPAAVLQRLLDAAVMLVDREEHNAELQDEVDDLGDQIESTYEEIALLHGLARNLQISRTPVELAQLCLTRMHGLSGAAGNVIWMRDQPDHECFLVEGGIPLDRDGLARLVARFEQHDWSRPLVRNHVAQTPLAGEFPGVENFVLVPIAEGTHRSGWILSCNHAQGWEFGSVEGSLLNSIATILGTHLRNIDLYRQHEELLLSFVRSLVFTLDAKDPYTRGHSERVALIGRRLGRELDLPEGDLQDIYLSGLLHDVGKIGVDDRILRKPGRLTDEEFRAIQKHPVIGYEILKGLTNLQKILPGVRNHHETYHGKGYPDGLAGEEIPLMARILAVADSYDAMGSDRPYREGMPVEQIEEIFRRGRGEQWDARVIDAYFAARDDVQRICAEFVPDDSMCVPPQPPQTPAVMHDEQLAALQEAG